MLKQLVMTSSVSAFCALITDSGEKKVTVPLPKVRSIDFFGKKQLAYGIIVDTVQHEINLSNWSEFRREDLCNSLGRESSMKGSDEDGVLFIGRFVL